MWHDKDPVLLKGPNCRAIRRLNGAVEAGGEVKILPFLNDERTLTKTMFYYTLKIYIAFGIILYFFL